jgi:hypothetical protein
LNVCLFAYIDAAISKREGLQWHTFCCSNCKNIFSHALTELAARQLKTAKNRRIYIMTEQVGNHQEREMVTLGMAFMGFLMGVGALCGIWFLSGLLQVLSKLMG